MSPDLPASLHGLHRNRYLLDVNFLLAAIWVNHPLHEKAFTWLSGKEIVLCPLTELGFLRVSSNKKAINAPMAKARELLKQFAFDRKADRIPDDLPALDSQPTKSDEVTDCYLADLALLHNVRLATFDQSIKHTSVELVI